MTTIDIVCLRHIKGLLPYLTTVRYLCAYSSNLRHRTAILLFAIIDGLTRKKMGCGDCFGCEQSAPIFCQLHTPINHCLLEALSRRITFAPFPESSLDGGPSNGIDFSPHHLRNVSASLCRPSTAAHQNVVCLVQVHRPAPARYVRPVCGWQLAGKIVSFLTVFKVTILTHVIIDNTRSPLTNKRRGKRAQSKI